MASTACFFDSVKVNNEWDREYLASDFAEYFARFVGNGVFPNPTTNLRVLSSGGMQVQIDPGYAWINGYLFTVIAGTVESLTIPVASATLGRIDSVIVGLNLTNREITAYIRSGSPSSNPVAVTLVRSDTVYELELAQIMVAAGASRVRQEDITDTRGLNSRCGFVTGLIDQIDTTELFEQFTAKFNSWFADLQNTLDENTAGNLLTRIQAIEGELEYNSKLFITHYIGEGQKSNLLRFPFPPKRLSIISTQYVSVSGSTICGKDELVTITSYGDRYSAVFTRFWGSGKGAELCNTVYISKADSEGQTVLSWDSGSATEACNERGQVYYVTAWG